MCALVATAANVYSASESDDLDFGALEAQLAELEEMASAPLGAEGSEGEASPKSASLERSADAELNDLDSLLHEARRLLRQQKGERARALGHPCPSACMLSDLSRSSSLFASRL